MFFSMFSHNTVTFEQDHHKTESPEEDNTPPKENFGHLVAPLPHFLIKFVSYFLYEEIGSIGESMCERAVP